jgi:hypothetical protein
MVDDVEMRSAYVEPKVALPESRLSRFRGSVKYPGAEGSGTAKNVRADTAVDWGKPVVAFAPYTAIWNVVMALEFLETASASSVSAYDAGPQVGSVSMTENEVA